MIYVSNDYEITFPDGTVITSTTSTSTKYGTAEWVMTTIGYCNPSPPPLDIEEKPHYLPVWVLGHLQNPPSMKKKEMYYTWARRRAL